MEQPIRLPPLTDTLQRLLSLDEDDRDNARLLELLITRDAVAIARVAALANSALYQSARPARTVQEAVARLGTRLTYSVLLNVWTLESLSACAPVPLSPSFKNRLASYSLSLLATNRRVSELSHASSKEYIDQAVLLLLVLLSQMLVVLERNEDPNHPRELEFQQLSTRVVGGPPLLFANPELPHLVREYCEPLAHHWGANPRVVELCQAFVRREEAHEELHRVAAADAVLSYRMAHVDEPFLTWLTRCKHGQMLAVFFEERGFAGLDPSSLAIVV